VAVVDSGTRFDDETSMDRRKGKGKPQRSQRRQRIATW
jgi:hypothetical protein